MKALTDKQIAEVQTKRHNGAKVMELAIEYHVHYRTIENYCRDMQRLKYREMWMGRFTRVE